MLLPSTIQFIGQVIAFMITYPPVGITFLMFATATFVKK